MARHRRTDTWVPVRIACLVTAWVSLAPFHAVAGTEVQDRAADEAFFLEQVQPLLEKRCYTCHSHAAGSMEGGLTLDARSGWANGGDRGPAVVPGDVERSLLIQAIRRTRDDLVMPPDDPLTAAEVAVLEAWVRRGAPDPRAVATDRRQQPWWSLQPLPATLPTPPAAQGQGQATATHPVDAYLDRRLAEQGLARSPRADRRLLIRRLYADLHGLPPSPEEVEAFVHDPHPLAYERLVDRLLASPRYGERWARHWLDVVHFAETHGFEHDVARDHAWRYRDYVITALNRDTPWDRFLREQLAADAFFPARSDLLPALGFLGAGPFDLSTYSTAPVTFDYMDRDDVVMQTMSAFASATVHCARCHAHKFDPISQEDYYALQAVFSGVLRGDIPFDPDPEVAARRTEAQQLLAAARQRDPTRLLAAADVQQWVARWETERPGAEVTWANLDCDVFLAEGATLVRQEPGVYLATGTRPGVDTYTFVSTLDVPQTLTAIRLDVLTHPDLPMQGPGRADNGNLHLNEVDVHCFRAGQSSAETLAIGQASADWNQEGWTISHAIDGNPQTAWGIYPRVGEPHYAVFQLAQPARLPAGSRLVVRLRQTHGGSHLIGRLRLSVSDEPAERTVAVPRSVEQALAVPPAERTEQQKLDLAALVAQTRAESVLAQLPEPALVYAAAPTAKVSDKFVSLGSPKTVHVLQRGNIQQPGAVAAQGALSAITGLPARFELPDGHSESARRAALADWLADPENPLTWRSIVNRVWLGHFGRGICDTPNDFGRMGGEPTHPELLDYLAVWFRDQAGGSLKQLHRLLVTSEAYRQVSEHRPDAAARDGGNRLLWRQNRRRLEAEAYRDAVRAVAGRLDLQMGGPSVRHFTTSPGPQATPNVDYSTFDWHSPDAERRSIYRFVWRGIPDTFMEGLDFPDLGLLAPQRTFSASALQALTLYNHDFVLAFSQSLAERISGDEVSLDNAVRRGVQLAWLRDPTDEELSMLVPYAQEHGLAALCRVLLNSNEFLFVE